MSITEKLMQLHSQALTIMAARNYLLQADCPGTKEDKQAAADKLTEQYFDVLQQIVNTPKQ